LVDSAGNVWAPGSIDTTLRHQGRVVLAESPPPGLPEAIERTLRSTAAGLARPGAAGASTFRFSVDLQRGEFRYTESLPELPAEYALVEATTGLDLAARQVHLSHGGLLKGEPPEPRGHAVQVCLRALDPEAAFVARPGTIDVLRPAAGAGLRADPEVEEGETPADPLDPALVRLTAHGASRSEALDRLASGLARTVVTVAGGATDKAFLAEVLDRLGAGAPSEPVWLDRLVASGEHLPHRGAEAALLAAAIDDGETALDLARARFLASAARGRPELPPEGGHAVELTYRGQRYGFRVLCLEPALYRVEVDGSRFEARVGPRSRTGRSLTLGRRRWQVRTDVQGNERRVEVDGIPHRVSLAISGPGDAAGTGSPGGAPVPARIRFDAPAGLAVPSPEGAAPGDGLAEVRRLMLGYDFDPAEVERQLAALPAAAAAGIAGIAGTAGPAAIEEAILRAFAAFAAFADIAALFRRQPDPGIEDDARHSAEEYLGIYLRDLDARGAGLPASFLDRLRKALAHYGTSDLDRSPNLEESLFRLALAHRRRAQQVPPVLTLLERLLDAGGLEGATALRDLLDRMIAETQGREPAVHDLAREVRYRGFDRPLLRAAGERIYAAAEADLTRLGAPGLSPEERAARIGALVECTEPLHRLLSQRFAAQAGRGEPGAAALRPAILEVMLRRYYRIHPLTDVRPTASTGGQDFVCADYEHQVPVRVLATHAEHAQLAAALAAVRNEISALERDGRRDGREVAVDLYLWRSIPASSDTPDDVAAEIAAHLAEPGFPAGLRRVAVSLSDPSGVEHFTFRPTETGGTGGYVEDRLQRGLHPMMAQRLELWRLSNFHLERSPAPEGTYLFHGVAADNPRDERLFALAEVRDLTPVRDASGLIVQLPQLEHLLMECLAGMRRFQSRRPAGERLEWNRVLLYAWPPIDLEPAELLGLVHRMAPLAFGLGLEKVAVRCRIPDRPGGALREWVLEISNPGEGERTIRFRKPSAALLKPLREYAQKVVELRRRGLVYPYEVVKRLAPRQETLAGRPAGSFAEHDLDAAGRLVPVDRPYGGNTANLVVGVVRNFTARHPEGMARVILLADPSRGAGALGEPECRRILAALDLAAERGLPLEWFALSQGGEDADGAARVLRRIVEHTRAGGEINLVVHGLNTGAQPFWNAAATTLLHTRGTLIITPDGTMVLATAATPATPATSEMPETTAGADDGESPGRPERILGPHGPAQYFARDLGEACRLLLAHYEHTYRAPGERFPRPAPTTDPRDREIVESLGIGEVSPNGAPPFEIRRFLAAVADQDHPTLERWYGMRDAEVAVVWEAHLGGHPVCLLGFESETLFPRAAKKVARAIGAASGNRPLVVLANLAGFDGSPESLRAGQLEYGAEIGRALVEFAGPIVVVTAGHCRDGVSLVFSPALNAGIESAALGASPPAIPLRRLRSYLIEAVERGMAKTAS
jgi:acetyl-CoA carboxylase carboxyltransferase component